MLVGWGGNNGSTLTGGVIANREWVHSFLHCDVKFLWYLWPLIVANSLFHSLQLCFFFFGEYAIVFLKRMFHFRFHFFMQFWINLRCGYLFMILRGISWATKDKVQRANYFGSLTQASSIRVGSYNGEEIYAPFKSMLPMVYISSKTRKESLIFVLEVVYF